MKTIKITPNETFKVEIEIEGQLVATQCVYMVSEGLTVTKDNYHFYPIRPTINFETALEKKQIES